MGDQLGSLSVRARVRTKCAGKDLCWYSGASISPGELPMSNRAGPLAVRVVTNGIRAVPTQSPQEVDGWSDHGAAGTSHNFKRG